MALTEDFAGGVAWQWQNNPESCLDALTKLSLGKEQEAFERLLEGQGHNSNAQDLYRAAHRLLRNDFWFIVISSSYIPPGSVDFQEVRGNIQWQYENNVLSLENAIRDWRSGKQVEAMGDLLFGQRHNIHVMDLYRASFRDNSVLLFDIVSAVMS